MGIFETIAEYLSFPFVRYALIVGVLTALCAALIGVPLVLKRVSFIGDGLSHVAFVGMAIAAVINLASDLYLAMPLTVIVSVILLGRGQNSKIKGDAAVAMLSVGSLAFGYFMLNTFSASSSNISGDVCASLFGSTTILTLKPADLWICIGMSAVVIVLYLFFYNRIFAATFDAAFLQATGVKVKAYEIITAAVIGIVISISMRLVGSLLTAALIIFPALSSMRIFKNFKTVVICSAVISVFCAATGMFASMLWGTPVGATIVMANLAVFIVFYLSGLLLRRKIV